MVVRRLALPSSAFAREGAAAFAISALIFNNGAMIGWSSPALPSMLDDQDWKARFDSFPYSESLAGASLCLVGVLGNLVTPPLLATLGPRRSLLLVCLPLFTLAWLGLVLARLLPSLGLVLASRALCGVPIGMSISIAPGFIIDIASPERQGLLGLLPQLMVSLGLLFSYVVGALVNWWWLSLVNLLLQPLLAGLLVAVHDSPVSLAARGRFEEARAALVWLRRPDLEGTLLQLQLKGGPGEEGAGLLATLGRMGRPANLRPMMASVSLMMALQLTGVSPLVFYSVQFFTWAGASTSPQISSIIVAAITLVTVMAVLLLAAAASRRRMMLASQAGVSVCLFVLAGYFLADSLDSAESIRWLPLLILILYFIFFNIGLSSFIWTITAEILPSGIRGQMIPQAILVSNVIWFLVTFFFKAMFDAMGGIFIFLFYGVCSTVFTVITFLFIPETTGRSQEEIALFFLQYSPPWIRRPDTTQAAHKS